MQPPTRAVLTPCIGVCMLGEDGLCDGCLRSRDEIARWSTLDDPARRTLMDTLPQRQALRQPPGAQARASVLNQLPERAALARALHPLSAVPRGPGWNQAEVADLIEAAAPTEAAVLAGLVPRPDGTRVLMTRRTDSLRHHAGQVSFPGGRMEPGDADAVAAAVRESGEEIALRPAQIVPLGFLDPFLTISGFRVIPVVAVVDPGYVPEPDPGEVAEVFEVPLDFLMASANLRRMRVDYQGGVRHVMEYDWPGQRIWGVTAAILWNLRERLAAVT